jgi:hypothetical protein
MRFKEVISLISVTYTEDEIGNRIEVPVERKIFANEFSVGASEYYNAALVGLRPAKQFEIYSFEYRGEDRLKHDGALYRIIRVETRGERTRLTCERVAADV